MIEPLIMSLLTSDAIPSVVDAWRKAWSGRRRRDLAEALILQLVELEAKRQGKKPLVYPPGTLGTRSADEVDALLPQGLDDIARPIAVEVWAPTAERPLPSLGVMRLSRAMEKVRGSEYSDLLFVHGTPLSDDSAGALDRQSQGDPATAVVLWGPDKIEALARQHQNELSNLLPELALAPVRAALENPEPNWREQSATRLHRLAATYQGEGIVLVLGAGVSIGSGLPNWDDLVSGLFVSLVTSQLSGRVDEEQALRLSEAARGLGNESPLLSARYLRRGIEDGAAGEPQAFHRALSSALYKNKGESSTVLLKALAKVCTPLRTGAKVHSVITYNFDDLLERQLVSEDVSHRSIYSARLHADAAQLPIFHAHGFLPEDVAVYEGLDEGVLAFSEEGYHQLLRDPYHWTNVVQLQAFQQRTCVFVGLSLTDPNLRRLLEYATLGRDEPRHFVFMKRASVGDIINASKSGKPAKPPVDKDAAADYLRVHHSLQERVFRELGLDVIWFESHKDMPAAVTRMRTTVL